MDDLQFKYTRPPSFKDQIDLLNALKDPQFGAAEAPEAFIDAILKEITGNWDEYVEDSKDTIAAIQAEPEEFNRNYLLRCLEILTPKKYSSLPKRIAELKKLRRNLKPKNEIKDRVTDVDIEKARSVPIETLYNFEKVKRTRKEFLALCPFHVEKTPSFSISLEKNLFHCWGCGEGGDSIKFFQKVTGFGFKESIQKMCAV